MGTKIYKNIKIYNHSILYQNTGVFNKYESTSY